MTASRILLLCGLALAVLSLGTMLLGQGGWVMALAVAKAWLITEGFMELRHSPWRWRLPLLAWALVVLALVGLVSHLSGKA
ncbi:cytochrome C oxidase subunit IV family protein [Pseudomonas piscis]|uniref:Cytochrome C oxidase subunit IV n=1 Tax=Pseudomonas piscis TaxID=2614538 RepID=A0A7X1PLS0_9PSED|nr:cytochrome C oxidase subunit IV family protein [Pseudomonas piscis]MQA54559.1 hypothetical protein [Pseudomonas piscis]